MKNLNEEISCDESVVIISAVRYMLGRSSYGVGCVCDYLKVKRKQLTASNKEVIIRDINEYMIKYPDMNYKLRWLEIINILNKDKHI